MIAFKCVRVHVQAARNNARKNVKEPAHHAAVAIAQSAKIFAAMNVRNVPRLNKFP